MADERAVSVAVAHVLTIGIATVLVSGLLLGAGSMLEDERDRTVDRELRTTGERLSTELLAAADRGRRTGADEVVLRPDEPETVVGGGYRVELEALDPGGECSGTAELEYDGCLTVVSDHESGAIEVPVSVPDGVAIDEGSARGGALAVVYDGNESAVTIRGT